MFNVEKLLKPISTTALVSPFNYTIIQCEKGYTHLS